MPILGVSPEDEPEIPVSCEWCNKELPDAVTLFREGRRWICVCSQQCKVEWEADKAAYLSDGW